MPETELKIRIEGDASGAQQAFQDTSGATKELKVNLNEAGAAAEANSYSMMEARHGVMLLGEEFGVHLPRALTTFVASLGPIGAAMTAAFPYLAILVGATLLIKALANIGEGAVKAAEATEKFGETMRGAMADADEKFITAEEAVRKFSNEPAWDLLGERFKIEETKQGVENVKALESQIKELVESAPATSNWLPWNWFDESDIKPKVDAFKSAMAGHDQSDQVAIAENWLKTQKDVMDEQTASGVLTGTALDNEQKFVNFLKEEVAQLTKKADAETLGDQAKEQAARETEAGKTVTSDKAVLDQKLANIQLWKAQQHEAFASGQIDAATWAVDELKATQDAAKAHENYLTTILKVYQQAGATEKATATQRELIALQTQDAAKSTETLAAAEEKHHIAVQKIIKDYAEIVDKEVTKTWNEQVKATEELTKAQEALDKSSTALKEAQQKLATTEAINAIRKQVEDGKITQQQGNAEMNALYQQDARNRVAAYTSEAANLKADEQVAQKELAAAIATGDNLRITQDKSTLDKILAQENTVAAQIANVWTETDQKIATDTEKRAQQQQKADQDVNRGMQPILSSMNTWIMQGGNLGLALAKSFTEIGIKMLENLAISELVGNQQKLKSAEAAASNTWAQVSNIPVVGPFLAPELAAAAFIGAMSFDTGGVSPGGASMLHPREAVLTPSQTENFQRMTESGGGNTVHLHYSPVISEPFNPQKHGSEMMSFMAGKMKMLGVQI